MASKEWVIAAPKPKMLIEPPPPPPPPVPPTRWELLMFGLAHPALCFVYLWSGLSILWSARTNPKVVDKTPIVTVFLLEGANLQQLWRMWTARTSAGQSVTAWLSVNLALWLWLNFYLVFNRQNKFAIWGTAVGIFLNALVLLTVIYFRYGV
jgi:hypothetical protein